MKLSAAIAVMLAALVLIACGDDEDANPAGTQGLAVTTTQTTTETATDTDTTAEQTPEAPASASEPSTGAPDEGISDRPGGPGEGSGGY
jgi:hypothetical protein